MKKVNVGIIGAGTIGTALARECRTRLKGRVRLAGIVDRDAAKESRVRKSLGLPPVRGLKELVRASDLLIEAASAGSVGAIAREALAAGKDLMVMSAGGLVGKEAALRRIARRSGSRLYVPSGAGTGIDGLKSAFVGGLRSVTLTTRKPPASYEGAPYVLRKKIRLDRIKKEALLFQGTAAQAVRAFPANINVSATLSLAGLGATKTRVRVFASPGLARNVPEVTAGGGVGRARVG